MAHAVKAVTFDFWSTLFQSHPVNKIERVKKLKATFEALTPLSLDLEAWATAVQQTWAQWEYIWHHEQRTLVAAQWVDLLTSRIQVSLSEATHARITQTIETAVLDYPPSLAPGARELLAELAPIYSLAIISDTGVTPGRILRQILTQHELIAYFTHLTFSDEIGVSKPHPLAFHSTLQALHVQPQEAVHVGDLLKTDIAGAKGVGMRAVQYIGIAHDTHSPQPPVTPDAIIAHHAEFRPLLESWNKL